MKAIWWKYLNDVGTWFVKKKKITILLSTNDIYWAPTMGKKLMIIFNPHHNSKRYAITLFLFYGMDNEGYKKLNNFLGAIQHASHWITIGMQFCPAPSASLWPCCVATFLDTE